MSLSAFEAPFPKLVPAKYLAAEHKGKSAMTVHSGGCHCGNIRLRGM
ncbi:hypothetical protein RFM98_04950 [Mesorhizobium sp. VK9D]|nr:hypothetical protein [Mesorhizobium sp. VK9D]MDX8452096.1 hypothetical protein [Mesorhizobium sp. VK9D]